MKKIYVLVMMLVFSFALCNVKAANVLNPIDKSIKVIGKEDVIDDVELDIYAPSAILMEVSTGKIIYQKNSTESKTPASMTKIMTMILVMEAISQNKLKMDDYLKASENASKMGGTTIYLDTGEEMTVEDLLKGLAITSANDAAIVFAESIGGSVEKFVSMMNNKAREIGCVNTHFVNPNGLPADGHHSCSYDMALMGRYLVSNYPDILKYTNIYEDYLRKGTEKEFWLVNTNKLVRFYEEVDGLKTGWTSESGYCLTATMKKNGIRFISVVMGAESTGKRNHDTMTMLNYGVNTYELQKIANEGDIIETVENIYYKPEIFNVVVSEDVEYLAKKGNELKDIKKDIEIFNNVIDGKIGTMTIYINGELYNKVDLIPSENVKKANFFDIFKSLFNRVFL